MALINTLRNKLGKLLVVAITVSIFSFILGDFLSNNSMLTGDNSVGEINGHTISLAEFQNEMTYQEQSFALYSNRQATESDKYMINERAWLWLKAQYTLNEEYDDLGIEVTSDELWDMIQGKNMDQTIKGFFSNQQTGEFDRVSFNQFISNPQTRNPQTQYIWNIIYRSLKPSRERLKYEYTIINSTNASEAEAMAAYHEQSDVAEVELVYVPFYSLSDSAVNNKITDAMVSSYYNKHKSEYEIKEQRSINYVKLPILPTAEDTLAAVSELEELKAELATVSDDSLFATSSVEEAIPFGRYHHGNIPARLVAQIDSLKKGEILGPYLEGNTYKIYKISDVYTEDTTFSARARHILIRWDDETDEAKAEAKTEAERIIGEIQGGANFAVMASQFGTDGTAQRGGDLGWFSSGQMVKPFQDAVFNTTSTGLITSPVETSFGYHIIDVTETKTNKMFAVATIDRSIIASDKTVDDVFRKADLFQSSVSDIDEFEAEATTNGFEVLQENNLEPMEQFVGDLGNARGLVQWSFRDASKGSVSDIFEINDNYVIAVVTEVIDDGYLEIEAVRTKIETELKKELKGQAIVEKLSGLSGSLQEIAEAYGDDAEYHNIADLKLSVNIIPGISGAEPKTIGKIFGMNAGDLSKAFAGSNGAFIVKLNNLTIAPEVADYSSFGLAIETTRKNIASQKIIDAVDEYADIEDKRYIAY